MLELTLTKRSDPRLRELMPRHYTQPKGFVGRTLCYAVVYAGIYFGHIVAGSATMHLPGRHEFLGTSQASLNNIINNTFFHVEPRNGRYPKRNFTSFVVSEWMRTARRDWFEKYGDQVLGFETLIELPRTGELYRRVGWTRVGTTKGFTCKREGGIGTERWSGRRVWNRDKSCLRPKSVWCYKP